MTELTSQSPAEIDTQIANLYDRMAQWDTERAHLLHLQAKNRIRPSQQQRTADRIDELGELIESGMAELEPLEAEFDRRGGWNRVFVVVGGHVHHTVTCRNGYYRTTDWRWVPEQSGRGWDAIMAEAGERMCTWCFPDAPTEYRQRTSRIEHPTERQRREAREQRDAERARKQAERDAKKVFDPETGKQVRTFRGELINTERACKSEIVNCLFWARIDRARARSMGQEPENADREEAHARLLADALAAKQGVDADKLYEQCRKRAETV